jgi:hypothetical protein
MKSARSAGTNLFSARRGLRIIRQATLIGGIVVGSIFCIPLHAQQSESTSSEVPSGTQIADNTGNTVADASPASDAPTTQPLLPVTLTFNDRLKLYEHSFVTPESLIGPLFGSGISQAEGVPWEWGGGMAGYGRRFGSSYGRSVIGRTIAFGVASVDHEDTRYHRSNETGVWRRTRHAVIATFVSPTTGGGNIPAFSRFAGAYGAGFVANAWEPPSERGTSDALKRGSTSLLSSVVWHVFEEFWPDIHNGLDHHGN